jgi:hypothetical protein
MSQSEAARTYGVSQGWISRLMTRYAAEGKAAFEARSRAPRTHPTATALTTVELVLQLRKHLDEAGLDAGADTIAWHLQHTHHTVLSRATINRILVRAGRVTPEPAKRPKSSYIRFEAEQPNETWQSDFTHYRLTQPDGRPGADTEIITWLDDHSRYALHLSAHPRITGHVVLHTFRETVATYGIPASTLTDNGMVYTVRFAGGRGGRTHLETELRRLNIVQKNSRPNHPLRQSRTIPANPQEMAPRPTTAATHDQPAAGAAGHLHRPVQPRPAAPLSAPPDHPGHRLPGPAQSRLRHRPHQRHPRPGPPRHHQQSRLRHPARRRTAPPHRHRPNLRRNLRHPARPRPQRPRHQRRHRPPPTRTHRRPTTRLPAHRPATRTTTPKEITRTCNPQVRAIPMS